MDEEIVDLRGLKCPLPALFARRALERAKPDTVIDVWVDDPMAQIDVPHMCRGEGFTVLDIVRSEKFVTLRLKRAAASQTD